MKEEVALSLEDLKEQHKSSPSKGSEEVIEKVDKEVTEKDEDKPLKPIESNDQMQDEEEEDNRMTTPSQQEEANESKKDVMIDEAPIEQSKNRENHVDSLNDMKDMSMSQDQEEDSRMTTSSQQEETNECKKDVMIDEAPIEQSKNRENHVDSLNDMKKMSMSQSQVIDDSTIETPVSSTIEEVKQQITDVLQKESMNTSSTDLSSFMPKLVELTTQSEKLGEILISNAKVHASNMTQLTNMFKQKIYELEKEAVDRLNQFTKRYETLFVESHIQPKTTSFP